MGYRIKWLLVLLIMLVLPACTRQQVIDSGHSDPPAVINAKLGLGYLRQGNYDVAQTKLEKALQQDPKLAMAHHYIAELYRQTGSVQLASKHFERAVKLDPDNPLLLNNYGVFLCEQKRYKEADQYFLKIADMPAYKHPDEAYENAGLCALRIPDQALAEVYFRKALKTNPRLQNSLFQMAQLNYGTHEYLEARAFLQRFFSIAGYTPQGLWLGVRIEREMGDIAALTQYTKLLLDKFPDSEEARAVSSIK